MLKIDSYCSHPARLFPHDRGFFAPYHRFVTYLIKHNVILLSFSVCKPAGSEFMFRYHQRIIPLPAMGFFQRRPRPYHTEVSVRLLGFCISHIETVIPYILCPILLKASISPILFTYTGQVLSCSCSSICAILSSSIFSIGVRYGRTSIPL